MKLRRYWLQKKTSRCGAATSRGSWSGRNTHAKPSTRNGRKCTREADILMLDVAENVGVPISQHKKKMSPERYTRYMDLMSECIVT